jgi:HK97 family phage portal protein
MLKRLLNWMFVAPYSATYMPTVGGAVPFVTPLTALRYSPVYRAVTLIASDIARTECKVSDGAADMLWRSPNATLTAFEFRRGLLMQALLWGNGFALINRTLGGELLELIPLDPDAVTLDASGPSIVYKTAAFGDVPYASMLHLRAPGYNGLWGESPIKLCNTSVTLIAAQEQMALEAYRNAGNPKIALIHPQGLSQEARQRIVTDYKANHAGSENTGKPLVLAEGMRIERISSTLDDTGLTAARSYSIGDVSRIYGVPASYLSDDIGSSYGSMEWLSRMYVDACLSHWMAALRAEILAKLATPFDSMTWDTDSLVRPGIAEQMAALRTGVEAGFLTRNEARARLDLPPIDGLDEPTLALNMGTGGGATNIGTDTSAQQGTANDF